MDDASYRREIEKNLSNYAHNVILSIDIDDQTWLNGQDMQNFLNYWRTVMWYYRARETNDTDISVLAVREWFHVMRMMRDMEESVVEPSSGILITDEVKKRAREIIRYLEGVMDEIIKEVERTVNSQ